MKSGRGLLRAARSASVRAPPRKLDASAYSSVSGKPIHKVVAAASLASPPPIQPAENIAKVRSSIKIAQATWTRIVFIDWPVATAITK